MLDQWRPAKKDLLMGGLTLAILPGLNIAKTLYDGEPFWLIVLTTLGILVLSLLLAIFSLHIRGPRGYDRQSDKQLIHETIDKWMKNQRFGRQEVNKRPEYSETLEVRYGGQDSSLQIGKQNERAMISIWGVLIWQQGQYNLDAVRWSNLTHDIALEMARFGVFSSFSDTPTQQIVFWVELPTSGLDEKAVVLSVNLIRRADAFIRILWARETTAVAIASQLAQGTAATPILAAPP